MCGKQLGTATLYTQAVHAEATSARPWRSANVSANGPDGHRPRATRSARDLRAPARRDAATSMITRRRELEVSCVQRSMHERRGRSGEGVEGVWAPESRDGSGCAPSERPQTGRPDPSRCRLDKPTPREAGDAKKAATSCLQERQQADMVLAEDKAAACYSECTEPLSVESQVQQMDAELQKRLLELEALTS